MNEPEADPKMPKTNAHSAELRCPTDALEGLCPACLLQQGAAAETATQPETVPFLPPERRGNGTSVSRNSKFMRSSARAAWARFIRPGNRP